MNKNPLGYAPGDETYIFRHFGDPVKVIVTKITPTGIVTVQDKNYIGQTIHRRFMPSGKEMGSAGAWHPDRLVSREKMAEQLAEVQRGIAKRALQRRWKMDVEALARLDPSIDRLACITMLQSISQNLEHTP